MNGIETRNQSIIIMEIMLSDRLFYLPHCFYLPSIKILQHEEIIENSLDNGSKPGKISLLPDMEQMRPILRI